MSTAPRRAFPLLGALLVALAACASAGEAAPLAAPSGPPAPAPAWANWPPSGTVNGAEAQERVKRGAILVDVRSADSFEWERLPGAVNLPLEEFEVAPELFEPKSRPIVLYCGAGIQSAAAARKLAELGFTHVYDLGPMSGWRTKR